MLAVADVTDFAIGHVIPGERGSKGGGDANIGICDCFRQFVAGHRGVVIEYSGVAAAGGAAATCLHIRQHAIEKMLRIKRARRSAVVGAEATTHAAG